MGTSGGEAHKERVKEGEYGGCVYIHVRKRRMKSVEIVLSRGRGRIRENEVTPCTTIIH
jgi:hypothetical protein